MTIFIPSPDWTAIEGDLDVALEPRPTISSPGLYNVRNRAGRIMLACDCERDLAESWLAYYQSRYAQGIPTPSGKGFYPDFGFHLVELTGDGYYVDALPDLCAA